jgi:hypothetical protein
VSAQSGLGCIPMKTPNRINPRLNPIVLTILETHFKLRTIKALIEIRRKKKYLGTRINWILSLPVKNRKISTTIVAPSTLRISNLLCIKNTAFSWQFTVYSLQLAANKITNYEL